MVNVGIRSGTNTLHGSAYAFGRDVNWDARNVFNPGPSPDGTCVVGLALQCDKLPTELEQFGAVVGGPIKKDKLFFFAGYEGLRSFVGNAFPAIVKPRVPWSKPSTELPNGTKPATAQNNAWWMLSRLQAAHSEAGQDLAMSPVSMNICWVAPFQRPATCTTCTGGLIRECGCERYGQPTPALAASPTPIAATMGLQKSTMPSTASTGSAVCCGPALTVPLGRITPL